MSDERILVFRPIYPEGSPMRYCVIDRQFLKTCTDVSSWIPLSEEVFTRLDSKPYKYENVGDIIDHELREGRHNIFHETVFNAARERNE